jgi:hypothetical protein
MLVIQVQMWPGGDKSKAYSMGTLTVALDPSTLATDITRGYTWRITRFKDKGTWKSGRIDGHNPKTRGPWDLIFRILRSAVGVRNKI